LADLIPFKGLVYSDSLKESMDRLTTPPYDIISKEAQKAFYDRHPDNVIRLELPLPPETETPEDNRYIRAKQDLDRMIKAGTLRIDDTPSLYTYSMTFRDPLSGINRTIRGFVGRIRLEEWEKKVVYPHERTLQGPKEDRMALFKATGCSFSQIYCLYPDKDKKIMGLLSSHSQKRFQCKDGDDVLHEFGGVTDKSTIDAVVSSFAKESLFIADGHHRYETYLAYRNYRRSLESTPNPQASYEFVTVFLASLEDENLSVLPTHRLIRNITREGVEEFVKALSTRGEITRIPASSSAQFLKDLRESSKDRVVIGIALRDRNEFLLCRLNVSKGEGVKSLDTYWLQEGVLSPLLGITPERIKTEDLLRYDKSESSVLDKVFKTKEYALAFFIRPVSPKVIEEVSLRGELMPQKSTYFYPKPLTGMVMATL